MSLLKQKAVFNFSSKKIDKQKKAGKLFYTFMGTTFVMLVLCQHELNAFKTHLEKKSYGVITTFNTKSVLNQALNDGDQEKIILNTVKLKYSNNRTGDILYLGLLENIINNTDNVKKITDSTRKILLATSNSDINYGLNIEKHEDKEFLNSCSFINPICLIFRNKVNNDFFIPNYVQGNKQLSDLQNYVNHSTLKSLYLK